MYQIFFEILLVFYGWKPNLDNSTVNYLKKKSIQQYNLNKNTEAEKILTHLAVATKNEPEVYINLGITLFKSGKYKDSEKIFTNIENSNNVKVAEWSAIYLAVINCLKNDTTKSIQYLENALRSNPKSEIARYNLELLKNKFEKHENRKKNSIEKRQIEALIKNKANNILEPLSEREDLLSRLSKINISESQAKIIFEALGKNEYKYLQNRKNKDKNSFQKGTYQTW